MDGLCLCGSAHAETLTIWITRIHQRSSGGLSLSGKEGIAKPSSTQKTDHWVPGIQFHVGLLNFEKE